MTTKITDILSFPTNDTDNSGPHNRQPISYYYRGWTIEETPTKAYTATSPDGKKTWTCSSNEAAAGIVDMEVED